MIEFDGKIRFRGRVDPVLLRRLLAVGPQPAASRSPPSSCRAGKASTDCLAVFAKHWTPGVAKTRLGEQIGDRRAVEIYRLLLGTTLSRFESIETDRCLVFAPAEQREDFVDLADNWQLTPQVEGNLGARLHAFFASQFHSGYQRVLVVGADSPNLPLAHIDQAWQLLDEYAVVLGPTDDGGYYLIGAAEKTPPALEGIPWGSSDVWEATLAALGRAGVQHAVLPAWYDIDRLPDLRRLAEDLANPHAELDEPLIGLRSALNMLLQIEMRDSSR